MSTCARVSAGQLTCLQLQLDTCTSVVQLQQSDGKTDHHCPFTPEANAEGIIGAQKVLAALDRSDATNIALVPETIRRSSNTTIRSWQEICQSAGYWWEALTRHGSG